MIVMDDIKNKKSTEGMCKCQMEPRGKDELEGYGKGKEYRYERIIEKDGGCYFWVQPDMEDSNYWEKCSEVVFNRYFEIKDSRLLLQDDPLVREKLLGEGSNPLAKLVAVAAESGRMDLFMVIEVELDRRLDWYDMQRLAKMSLEKGWNERIHSNGEFGRKGMGKYVPKKDRS